MNMGSIKRLKIMCIFIYIIGFFFFGKWMRVCLVIEGCDICILIYMFIIVYVIYNLFSKYLFLNNGYIFYILIGLRLENWL